MNRATRTSHGPRAGLDKKPEEVASMFDEVAHRYDITNDVLSLGQTRRWRKKLVQALSVQPGERVLDLAAGTGTSTLPFHRAGAEAVACDFSPGMLEVGRRRYPELNFVEGDAMDLPFEDNSFDAVTISFGLRNIPEPETALSEMLRVTKPAGRLAVMEFSHPANGAFRTVYNEYLMKALPPVARRFSSNPDAYVYLAESIRAWPDQNSLGHIIEDVGYANVKYRNLTGGVVAIHHATKPRPGRSALGDVSKRRGPAAGAEAR